MLKRLALTGLVTLLACDPASPPTPTTSRTPTPTVGYVAIYFEREGRLVPEYHPLERGEPAQGVWELLAAGPRDPQLDTAVPATADLVQAAEPEEGRLLLELNDAFWARPDEDVYRAAAQIVYSMSSVEGGRAVTLIDGLRPGVVRSPKGRVLAQPLTQEEFPAPLVRVTQPVAGATVGSTIPIDLTLVPPRPVAVSLEVDGEEVTSTTIRSGTGQLVVDEARPGPALIRIEAGPEVTVEVPLIIAGRR